MDDETKHEILDRLDEGEKIMAAAAGAFPMWIQDYELETSELAEIIRECEKVR